MFTVKVGSIFDGETEWHLLSQTPCTGVFALCNNGLVKLTHGDNTGGRKMSASSTETNGLSVLMMTKIEREERTDFRCLDVHAINIMSSVKVH